VIEVKVYNIKVDDLNKSDSNTKDTYPMVEYQFYGFLMDEIQLVNEQNARLKAEVNQLSAFCTRTIIPNGILQADVNQLKIELADAQESYHIINEIIASERNVHRMNTTMLKDQIDGLHLDNRLLGERVLAYQRLKQLNDISRPPNEA
jgi:hypothetical protein